MKNIKFDTSDVFLIDSKFDQNNEEVRGIFTKDLNELYSILNEDNEIIKSKIISLNKESMVKLGFKFYYQCDESDFYDSFILKCKNNFDELSKKKSENLYQQNEINAVMLNYSTYIEVLNTAQFNSEMIDKIISKAKDDVENLKKENKLNTKGFDLAYRISNLIIPENNDEIMKRYYEYKIELKNEMNNLKILKDEVKSIDRIQNEIKKFLDSHKESK